MWVLDINLPHEDENDVFNVGDKIQSILKEHPVSSGSDFITRDIQYEFYNEVDANIAFEDVSAFLESIYKKDVFTVNLDESKRSM